MCQVGKDGPSKNPVMSQSFPGRNDTNLGVFIYATVVMHQLTQGLASLYSLTVSETGCKHGPERHISGELSAVSLFGILQDSLSKKVPRGPDLLCDLAPS